MKNSFLVIFSLMFLTLGAHASSDYLGFLTQARPHAQDYGAFTIVSLSQPKLEYAGYTKEDVCTQYDDSNDERGPVCIEQETHWTPTVVLTLQSKVILGFGIKMNIPDEKQIKVSLNNCLKNKKAVTVVGNQKPSGIPQKLIYSKNCQNPVNPIFRNEEKMAAGGMASSFYGLLSTHLKNDLTVLESEFSGISQNSVARQLLSSLRVSENYDYEGEQFDRSNQEYLLLLTNYAH